jgi:hypothetical protein
MKWSLAFTNSVGGKKSSYELLTKEGHAFIYSNWVIVNKFAMTQANHKLKWGKLMYKLPSNSLKQIKVILVESDIDHEIEGHD